MPETFANRLARQAADAFPDGLRLAQDNVLSQYAALPDLQAADVGIELPTGEGKSLIGLLLADWALDAGLTVAYLTGTKQLTQQVLEQAGRFDDRTGALPAWPWVGRAADALYGYEPSGGTLPERRLGAWHPLAACQFAAHAVVSRAVPSAEASPFGRRTI